MTPDPVRSVADHAESRRRLDIVERAMYEVGWSARVARALAAQFDCDKRTVYRYRAAVLVDVREATQIDSPASERADFLQRLRDHQRAAKADGAWGALSSMMNCEAKILGVEVPLKVEHSGALTVAGMSDAQAEALDDAIKRICAS